VPMFIQMEYLDLCVAILMRRLALESPRDSILWPLLA
jgi:hypothetical protein